MADSTWWMLKLRVTATSRQMPRPRVRARNTPISVSGGRLERRLTYTIPSAESRQNAKIPPYGALSGSPSSSAIERPVSAACPRAALKKAIRRATTRWLKPPSSGASTSTQSTPRTRNAYWKSAGSQPAWARAATQA